ncbi:hypothetical protein [Luteimonas sp. SDU101]|uniref:hypothetical protein n=1 Tax=Luteimonas sp. SDU101 TaxID=3422593 RepID=UPI003EBCE982
MDMPAVPAAAALLPVAELRTGDVLLMMGEGPLSDLIAWASDSIYSHAALVADAGDLVEASTVGVRRYPLATRLADQAHYHFIDALRMEGPDGALDQADGAAVLARALGMLGTPYPVDQLALFGAIMAVRGKWPEHPWGRLLVRVAFDHALPEQAGRMVCSEVVYRAYAECAVLPPGRLAPVIVVGPRGTTPFPEIDWKALFDEIWPLLQPEGQVRLQPARLRLNALRSGELQALHAEADALPGISDAELEAARQAVLGQGALRAATASDAALQALDGDGTVIPDPNPRLVSPQDLRASPSLRWLGRLMQRGAD